MNAFIQRLLAALSRPQHPDSASPVPARPAPAPRAPEHPHAKAYALARKEVGTREKKGPKHEAKIVKWFALVGHSWVKDDETAWCAAFVGAMLQLGGLPSTRKLNARSYMDWGSKVALKNAQPGDVVIFTRGDPKGWQGHVAFFVRQEGDRIVVLGGNQSNMVNEAPYAASRLLGVRRWKP